jgi:hypothetical protein
MEALSASKELAQKLAQLEQKIEKHDKEITLIFNAIRKLMATPAKPHRSSGFAGKDGRISGEIRFIRLKHTSSEWARRNWDTQASNTNVQGGLPFHIIEYG